MSIIQFPAEAGELKILGQQIQDSVSSQKERKPKRLQLPIRDNTWTKQSFEDLRDDWVGKTPGTRTQVPAWSYQHPSKSQELRASLSSQSWGGWHRKGPGSWATSLAKVGSSRFSKKPSLRSKVDLHQIRPAKILGGAGKRFMHPRPSLRISGLLVRYSRFNSGMQTLRDLPCPSACASRQH